MGEESDGQLTDLRATDQVIVDARRQLRDAGNAWTAVGGDGRGREASTHPVEWANYMRAMWHLAALNKRLVPPYPKSLLRELRIGEATAIEDAIAWLETDPFEKDTGYIKQKFMAALCGAPMTGGQEHRLRLLLLRVFSVGPRMEFRDACRLARRVDSEDFRSRLRELTDSADDRTVYVG